jgi:hypothetical protein
VYGRWGGEQAVTIVSTKSRGSTFINVAGSACEPQLTTERVDTGVTKWM